MAAYYQDRFGGGDVYEAPTARGAFLRDRALWRAVTAAVLLALVGCAASEYLLVSPVAEARDSQLARHAEVSALNRENEATLADYEAFLATKAETDRRFEAATAAVPTEAELATVLESIRELAANSRMRLVRFTPERAASPAAGEGGALQVRRATVVVRGGYRELESLLSSLGSFSRLLTVDSFTAARPGEGDPTLEATIGLTCYFKASPQAAR